MLLRKTAPPGFEARSIISASFRTFASMYSSRTTAGMVLKIISNSCILSPRFSRGSGSYPCPSIMARSAYLRASTYVCAPMPNKSFESIFPILPYPRTRALLPCIVIGVSDIAISIAPSAVGRALAVLQLYFYSI